jgi:hypothetical protein
MSYEKEVNREIPCFPIFFKVSTIPPIHIKTSIAEFDNFRNNIE